MRKIGAALVLLLLCAGCGQDVLFQADTEIAAGGWDRAHKPAFTFDVQDTVNAYDLFIDVRHTGDYPYSGLYLFVDIEGPGLKVPTDTVECLLADATGRWYGKGLGFIFADRFQAHVLYKLNNRFPRSGSYTITLEQAMRDSVLPGVLDVGISVERAKPLQP